MLQVPAGITDHCDLLHEEVSMTDSPQSPREKVPAANNTLRILKLLASRRAPAAAASIASALDLPRSTVYQILTVMVHNGFVLHLPEERKYGLGLAAFELSSSYSRQEPLSRLGTPLLAGLVDKVGESAHLAVLHGHDIVYIVEERAKFRPALVTDVGVRLPGHLTASGRAILAEMPRAQVRALYPSKTMFVTRNEKPSTVSTYAELSSLLKDVRHRQYAYEEGDVTPDFTTLAVAVKDHLDWPAAAVAVTFQSDNVPREEWDDLVQEIQSVADELSQRIHGRSAPWRH